MNVHFSRKVPDKAAARCLIKSSLTGGNRLLSLDERSASLASLQEAHGDLIENGLELGKSDIYCSRQCLHRGGL
jgi:hypothetical protein